MRSSGCRPYIYICDHICINQAYGTKVEFSAGAKVVNTLPFYAYISKSENPNNFTVESLNKKLKTSAYSVYKSLFNGVLISEFIKCAICLVYANMVTYIYLYIVTARPLSPQEGARSRSPQLYLMMHQATKQERMASLNPSHKPYITINREAARNIGNYVRVGKVSPADMSGTVATIMKHWIFC